MVRGRVVVLDDAMMVDGIGNYSDASRGRRDLPSIRIDVNAAAHAP